MAYEVILPKQGWTMEEANFVEWLKEDGDGVKDGEPLFSVETDKTVQEIEALDSGILHIPANGPDAGDIIRIGDVIGFLLEAGETAPELPESAPATAEPESASEKEPVAAAAQLKTPAAVTAPGGAAVSPRAARRAVAEGVDLRNVTGTGRGGRIRESDVLAAAGKGAPVAPTPAGPPGKQVAVSGLRRTIAERMVQSKTATAPVTLTTRVNAGALATYRAGFKAGANGGGEVVPSYGDMIMKLVAEALKEHPVLNARWEGDGIVHPDAINIGLAVDTDDGLIVPVVRDVPSLSLSDLARRTSDLANRARERKLKPEELEGGTFTITNLGSLGVDAFTPIINHPECAILGVGRIVREPAADGDEVVIRDLLWLSLTFDHRIVDGAPAARFLDAVHKAVEDPPAYW